jgi:hypothetical protein
LDADATLTLRATLVNAAGEATHLEHEEATIALDSEMESAPTGGREIRGDWAPKPYDDGFGVYYKIDDLWNYERLPGVPDTMGIGEPDHVLQGSSGSDHIVATDQLLEVIYADAGDDVLTDNENWWMYANGGAGTTGSRRLATLIKPVTNSSGSISGAPSSAVRTRSTAVAATIRSTANPRSRSTVSTTRA